jgi:hypothetical protein
VLGLLAEDRQGAQQRQPGVHHRRHLARHDSEILELDLLLEEGDVDVGLQAGSGRGLVDLDRRDTHRAEP